MHFLIAQMVFAFCLDKGDKDEGVIAHTGSSQTNAGAEATRRGYPGWVSSLAPGQAKDQYLI